MGQWGGFAKQKALRDFSTKGLQSLALFLRFDAFNHQPQPELVGEIDRRFDNRMHHGMVHLLRELFVEFDDVKRQTVQTAEARLARTKVVHHDANAALTQGLQAQHDLRRNELEVGFRDFKIQLRHHRCRLRIQPCLDKTEKIVGRQVPGREVHTHTHTRVACQQAGEIFGHLGKNLTLQGANQTSAFRQGNKFFGRDSTQGFSVQTAQGFKPNQLLTFQLVLRLVMQTKAMVVNGCLKGFLNQLGASAVRLRCGHGAIFLFNCHGFCPRRRADAENPRNKTRVSSIVFAYGAPCGLSVETDHNDSAHVTQGLPMNTPDRRLASNAALREKINALQDTHQRLKDTSDALTQKTLALARAGVVHDLPDPALQQQGVTQLLALQKDTLAAVQSQLLGADKPSPPAPTAPLVSAEEMAALLDLRSD